MVDEGLSTYWDYSKKIAQSSDAKNTLHSWNLAGINWNPQSLNSWFIRQNPCSWQWSNTIQNGGSILNTACSYHSEYVLQTGSMAHLWAFHIRCLCDWCHRLVHLPLFSPQSWFIRLVFCDLAPALPTTSPVETPCGHIHHYLESRWAKASDRNIHTCAHTAPSSHSHWACARGQVSLPLPPLWKDLSPRGLSCLVGQRGKRLCEPAKWGTGPGMHEANSSTHTAGLHEPCSVQSLPICGLWSLSACQDLHKEINSTGKGIHTKIDG